MGTGPFEEQEAVRVVRQAQVKDQGGLTEVKRPDQPEEDPKSTPATAKKKAPAKKPASEPAENTEAPENTD